MKVKGILIATVFLATVVGAKAQTGVETGTQFGSGADSLRCRQNISLAGTNIQAKNFADALPQWKSAYEECPAATRNLYSWGEQIIKWQMSEAKDAAEMETYFNDLMALYDKRIKYFGDDPTYNTNWIMAKKANDYNTLKGENADPAVMYGWLKPILEEYKENTETSSLALYMFASQKLMGLDPDKYASQYIQDFLDCSALFDAKMEAAKAANQEDVMKTLEAYKSQIEYNFTLSGAADCATMENVYASKIEAQQTDLEFLNATLVLFQRVGCMENDTYFAAANYAHKMSPTASSAMGLAGQAFKKNDYALAEKYFLDAAELSTDNEQKASCYIAIVSMASSSRNWQKVRQYSLRALEANPNMGRAYLQIGLAYANSANSISDDPVLRKTAYWAAVDKFQRARQVDPESAAEANRLINQYSQYFPSTEEVFMHPDLKPGESYTVGGWINERTTVR